MAKIPFLTADQTAGSGANLPTSLGAQPAAGIASAAGQVASTYDQFEQQYVQARRLSAASELNAESYQRLGDAEFKASQIPDRQQAIAQFQSDSAAIKSDMGDRIVDPLLKANWQSNFDQRAITGELQTGHAAFGLESDAQQANLASRMEQYSHQYAQAGSDIERAQVADTAQEDVKAITAGHWISPLQGEEHIEKFRQRGDAALARRDIDADPAVAVKKLQDPTNYPWLDEYRREMMLGVAESRARARSDEAKGVAQQNYEDNYVSIMTTGEPVAPQSRASLVGMFGATRGNKMASDLDDAQSIFGFTTKTKMTTPDEDRALLEAHKPQGPGFADQQKVYNTLLQVIQQKQKALQEDPAQFAYQAAPELAQAMQAAQKDPSKMPTAEAMLNSVYDRLGQPSYNRPIMSKAQAGGLAQTIMAAPADQRAQTLTQMGDAYGSAWPQVMRDMVKDGKLPTAYEVLPAIPNPGDRITYANALGDGKRALQDMLDPEDKKTIDNEIRDNPTLQSLRQSAAFNDRGGKKADDIEEAARMLAYAKMQQGGIKASNAADSAVQAIVGDKFDFVGDGMVRAPKGLHDQVAAYGNQVLNTLKPEDLPVPANPAGKKLTDAQLRQTYLDSIRRKGVWVTNENGDGMVMLDEQRNPVMLKNGQRLEAPFSAARAMPLPTVTPEQNFIAP